MSQLEVDKVIPQSGTTLTLGESGDTVSVPSGATLDASNATLTLPDGTVTNAKVNASAAIDYSKLNLATSIVNADISTTAAIATTKLGAGAVLQVVSTTKTDTFATSSIGNTFVDVTGLSVSITPSSASNKILIFASVNHGVDGIRATALKLLRNSTDISIGTGSMGNRTPASTVAIGENYDTNRGENSIINFLDSPSTTSSTTYKIQVGILEATTNVARVNTSGGDGDFTYIARSASTITVMEIAG